MEEKLMKVFEKLTPIIGKISNNKWVTGMSHGMMGTLPFTVLGSFSLLLTVVPLAPLNNFITNSGLEPVLNLTTSYSIGMVSVLMVIFITKNIVSQSIANDDGLSAAVAALFAFLIVTPGGVLEVTGGGAIPTKWLGAQGAFTAIIVALVSAKIFIELKQRGFTIKMPDGVPPMVTSVFEGIIPTIAVGVFFILVSYVFTLTPQGSMHDVVYSLLQAPLQQLGGSLGALLFVSFIINVLWFIGIHGQNVIMPFINPIWLTLGLANLSAIANGDAAPNIITGSFYELINFGGYQLSLIFLLLTSKSKQFKEVGKLTLGPAIFGIGEPLNFGLPLCLNFKFIIPFLTNSVLMLLLSWVVIRMGIISPFNGSPVIFGLPIGVGAFLQGGWGPFLLQIATQIIPVFLWLPWFKMAEKEALALEANAEAVKETNELIQEVA